MVRASAAGRTGSSAFMIAGALAFGVGNCPRSCPRDFEPAPRSPIAPQRARSYRTRLLLVSAVLPCTRRPRKNLTAVERNRLQFDFIVFA